MSSSHALGCLPSALAKKQKHDFHFCFLFVQCIIKQLLDSEFVISRIIKASVRLYTPYLDLDYSGYHKNLIQYVCIRLLTTKFSSVMVFCNRHEEYLLYMNQAATSRSQKIF